MDALVKDELSAEARALECAASQSEASGKAKVEPVPPLECSFEGCVGGFVSERSVFCFRITSDGELRGEVWRRRPTANAVVPASHIEASASGGSGGIKRRRVEVLDPVKSDDEAMSSRTATDDEESAAPATGACAAVWPGSNHVLIAHIAGTAVFVKMAGVSSSSSDQVAVRSEDALKPDAGTARLAASEAELFEYCCSFNITKRADHIDRHTVQCHMHIPTANEPNEPVVAAGEWSLPYQRQSRGSTGAPIKSEAKSTAATAHVSLSQPLQPKQELFKLTRVDPTTDSSAETVATRRSRLYPLRPGKYDFQGFTTYETPAASSTPQRRGRRGRSATPPVITKDECIVSLRLFPDGTLRGTSCELVHPQVCTVYGNWQVNRVIYILEYHVRDAVGRFRYSGGVDTSGEGEKLVGKWRNVDEGHADGFEGGKGEFELGLVRARHDMDAENKGKREKKLDLVTKTEAMADQVVTADAMPPSIRPGASADVNNAVAFLDDEEDLTVTALTSGHYRFKGEATDSDGYEYAFELVVTLYPDGQLEGASSERIFEQTRPVTGRWNRLSFAYQQEYVVRREVGIYLYAGELSSDGVVIRGQWRNAEAQYASVRSEHGTFALAITSAERFWSTNSHRDFPRGFRDAVHCLLLCSARSHVLPGALWTHILAFCDEKWFAPHGDEDVKSVDEALECKPDVFV